MSSPGAFPPTPQAQPAPPPGANPVGQAVAGAQPQLQGVVQRFKAGVQAIQMLSQAVKQAKPEAAAKMEQGLAMIMQGISILKGGGQPGPTAPQGQVPPPPQMAAESPEQTPEAS